MAGSLRAAGLPGDVSIYGDLMYEGPTPAGLQAEEWRETRARFLAEAGYTTLDEARQYLKGCEDALAAYPSHEEVVLWLDHRLSDQLILIKVLEWFGRRDRGAARVSLICVDRYPGVDDFAGLGQLTTEQLATLANQRQPVSDRQFALAQKAWNAFTSPDPTLIEGVLETDTSPLPFVANAFRRHLEEFPWMDGGLSRTEREGLSVLREQGPLSGRRLFAAVQRLEEQRFMGDTSFYRIMAALSKSRQPLCRIPDGSFGEVSLTATGQSVIEGNADHIERNGIDRWLGGVHLKGDDAQWRWDSHSARLAGL